MHHTDYDHNLRQAKHIAAKNWATNATSGNSTQKSHTNPLSAAVAVFLAVVAILQMNPANAEPTMDVPGYGTLQFTKENNSIRAKAITSNIDVVIEDDHFTMTVDQTFINQTAQIQHGEYGLALPKNATISFCTKPKIERAR